MRPAFDPAKEDIYHVAGDQDTGITKTADMTAGSIKVQLRYNGKWGNYVCTVDLYLVGDTATIVMICPRCHHSIQVPSTRKNISWDPEKGLFVETSECPWEIEQRDGERIDFGLGLCRFRFAIDGVDIKDA